MIEVTVCVVCIVSFELIVCIWSCWFPFLSSTLHIAFTYTYSILGPKKNVILFLLIFVLVLVSSIFFVGKMCNIRLP